MIKALKIKTSKIFNLVFPNNTIFLLIIGFYFLTPAVTAQIFNKTSELAMPLEILTEEVKGEIETHPVIS